MSEQMQSGEAAEIEGDAYAEVRALASTVSNWGRWGSSDELGTLNLIDSDAMRRGAACVRLGVGVPLGFAFGPDGPQTGSIPGRVNPQHYVLALNRPYAAAPHPRGPHFSDDALLLPLQASTQWDSLAHVQYDGYMYNRAPIAMVDEFGAHRNGIDKQSTATFCTRGVLLDIPGSKGLDRLAPSALITPDDLDAGLEHGRVTLAPGDVVLMRTGHLRSVTDDDDRVAYALRAPGIGIAAIPWLHDHEVAAVASDNSAIEVRPFEDPDVALPVHMLGIRDMGMPFGEIFDLEALAVRCANEGVYEFMFCAQPLGVTRGLGSPVNPVAVL